MSERTVTEEENSDPLDDTPRCLCGKLTTFTCGELWPPITLTRCPLPLCETSCTAHRHAPGTMGYTMSMSSVAQYQGDEPDGPGLWEWVKSRCREWFWTDRRKAERAYREICENFAAPTPWPYVQIRVGRQVFESDGPNGVKLLTDAARRLRPQRMF